MAIQSKALPAFWTRFKKLPADIQTLAKSQFKRFKADPYDPLLHFEPKKGKKVKGLWSVDVDFDYRAVCLLKDGVAHWFFIGDHNEYTRMLAGYKSSQVQNPSR